MTNDYHEELQLSLDGIAPTGHVLVKISNVGTWFIATCACGDKSRVLPARSRVERWHRAHVRWHESHIDERRPRRGGGVPPRTVDTMRDLGAFG